MAKLNLDENEIKRLYVEEKKMIKEIADIMNCDRNVIARRLQKLGLKEGKSYKQPKEKIDKLADKKELMKTLYLKGKTCREIGEVVNLNEKTVSYHLKNLGIKLRPQKKINQEDFERIRKTIYGDYVKEYNDVTDIARMFLADYFKGINSFEYVEQIGSVNIQYVEQVLKEVFNENKMVLSVVRSTK